MSVKLETKYEILKLQARDRGIAVLLTLSEYIELVKDGICDTVRGLVVLSEVMI